MAEAERLRQSLLADAGRGDLLKTIIDWVELRPNGLRMILSLVPLTPAAAPPNRLQGCVFTREFPLRIKRRWVEMRFAIDAPDPRATNPDPVLFKEVKRARRCFDALRPEGRRGGRSGTAGAEIRLLTNCRRLPDAALLHQGNLLFDDLMPVFLVPAGRRCK